MIDLGWPPQPFANPGYPPLLAIRVNGDELELTGLSQARYPLLLPASGGSASTYLLVPADRAQVAANAVATSQGGGAGSFIVDVGSPSATYRYNQYQVNTPIPGATPESSPFASPQARAIRVLPMQWTGVEHVDDARDRTRPTGVLPYQVVEIEVKVTTGSESYLFLLTGSDPQATPCHACIAGIAA